MKYGLIGEKLTHSFSKEIHNLLGGYDYELCELKENELDTFFKKKDFCGINVTIPYKTSVIKYLDCIDDTAQQIGAVNTVVNKDGKLFGYNTDAFGLSSLIRKYGVDIRNKKVLILGGGGTSKTALFVAQKLGAKCVIRVSRTEKEGFVTYTEARELHTDANVLINTTPVGMYPDTEKSPIDISEFNRLEAVFDAIYNPLNSRLILAARQRGIIAAGGLYMLVAQAYKSAELFSGKSIDESLIDKTYKQVLNSRRNIVLIGMPSSGKSTIGGILSNLLKMPLFDTDEHIFKMTGKTPADIINREGEAAFRRIESKVIADISVKNHCIIATGGGAVTVDGNIIRLKANGKVYYIDRPVDLLKSTPDRPLSSSAEALKNLYDKRKDLYNNAADLTVKNDADINTTAEIIRKDFLL